MTQDRKYFTRRLGQLDTAYQIYRGMWQELADYYLPRTCKFLVSDVNRKPKFSKAIVDSSTGIAVRNFASGMMSGATNPAHKWFKVDIKNYKNKNDHEVKTWCADVSDLFRNIFNNSNFYNCLPNCYLQMGVFGISAMSIEKDFEIDYSSNTTIGNVINCKVLPIGSYKIAKDHRGVVDTLYRCYMETVGNIVDKFGIDNVSEAVKTAYEKENYEQLVEIVHAVEPNLRYSKKSKFSKDKKYKSVYFEKTNSNKFLSESGFNHFPYVVFETMVNGEDVYPSNSPGIESFSDVKQLMAMIRDYNKALKKIVSPPLTGPSELKNKKIVDAPASFTPVGTAGAAKLEAIYQVDARALTISQNIQDIKKIIGQIFYNDLFAMLTNSDFTQPRTATELNMRKEEALVLLSPLLQQVHSGQKQVMNITFEICLEIDETFEIQAGKRLIPMPPKQIQGSDIDIEFVSTLAQAQKAAVIGATERFVTFAANLSQATGDRTAIMKLNVPEIIDDYASFANIETDNVIPTEVVQAQMAAAAKAQQQQQQMAALQQGSEIIKNMGGADASGGNLMERIGLQ